MEASINTTGSGDPTLTPSRCNRFAESRSEGCSLPPSLASSFPPMPISITLFTSSSFPPSHLYPLPPPLLYSSIPAVTRPVMAQAWNLVLHGKVLTVLYYFIFNTLAITKKKKKMGVTDSSMQKLWMRQWWEFSTYHCHSVISAKAINKSIKTLKILWVCFPPSKTVKINDLKICCETKLVKSEENCILALYKFETGF